MIVRVPGSSANLGPGFDVLGMAVDIYAEAGVIAGPLPGHAVAVDEHHPATKAFRRHGGAGDLWVRCRIPMGRGLGFSGAVRVAGLVAAHAQRHGPGRAALESARPELLAVAAELEGHPDNVAASLYGGVVAAAGGCVQRIALGAPIELLAWVPSVLTSTDKSRAGLPGEVTRDDAVFNVGRTALLVAALANGDLAALRTATDDRLHQGARFAAAPASAAAHAAALGAGAAAAWLSGSGPTVLIVCEPGRSGAIASELPPEGKVRRLAVDVDGAVIVADEQVA
jgi:homoserine kinase